MDPEPTALRRRRTQPLDGAEEPMVGTELMAGGEEPPRMTEDPEAGMEMDGAAMETPPLAVAAATASTFVHAKLVGRWRI